MNAAQKQHEKGFTIIEVVLVLAIAGLIFLMVFIALPALQRNQRDTARKSDASNVASSVSSFSGNNRGSFPTTAQLQGYVTNVSDNTTSTRVNATTGATSVSPTEGQVIVTKSTRCGTSSKTAAGAPTVSLTKGSNREFTVVTWLEAGNGSAFCQES